MGGRVEKFARGWAAGPTDYDFNGQTVTLNAWHQDQVVVKPAAATVAARNDFCENAALLYDDRMFTVQAHPEFTPDFVQGLMQTRGKGVVPDAVLSAAAQRLAQPQNTASAGTASMAARIAAFFKAKAGASPAKVAVQP
jgi:GMP synthase (glutamine-hydrolysing)